jgi:lipopolysaccharide export system protein LptC
MTGNSTGAPLRPAAAARGAAAPRRIPSPSRARRMPTSGQIARRRILVGIAKRVLPLAGVGLLALIALWPEFDRAEDRGRLAFRRVTQAHPDAVRVVDPRYQGLDEQNRPYNLTAEVATQLGSSQVVQLEKPRADILTSDGAWVLLQAQDGRFDRGSNHLDLAGEVTIHHDDGTQFVTERAAVELGAGTAEGDAPVAAQGPWGTLTAEGFSLTDRGQVVVFTGRSRAVLEGRQ